jgi:hypothetical protein
VALLVAHPILHSTLIQFQFIDDLPVFVVGEEVVEDERISNAKQLRQQEEELQRWKRLPQILEPL